MGIIHKNCSIVFFCKGSNFRKFGYIAFHTKNTIGNNKFKRFMRNCGKEFFQVRHIGMAVFIYPGKRKPCAINNACMVEFI